MESFFQRSIMKSRDASGSKERPSVARVACSRCYAVLCCMCQSPEKLLQCKLCSRMQATALFAGYQKRRHGATLKVAGQTSDGSLVLVDVQGAQTVDGAAKAVQMSTCHPARQDSRRP
jgi:hypothetical protein